MLLHINFSHHALQATVTHLTGTGVHVSLAEKLLHDAHVLWRLHGSQRGEHDGRVPGLILLVHVAYV